jgi:uncharacterized repeat protein (TIGR03803 family)
MLHSSSGHFARDRRTTFLVLAALGIVSLLAMAAQPAHAQTYNVIYNFPGDPGGATPYAGPTLDQFGNLYGSTYLGGATGNGSIYRLTFNGSSWIYSTLYSFFGVPDGSAPAFGSVTIGPDNRLYGTTESGGVFGTVWSVQPAGTTCASGNCLWKDTVLHRFGSGQDGSQPIGGVVLDADGAVYGTNNLGGASGNGAVFKVTRSGLIWNESLIYSFTGGTDAVNPVAGVTLDPAGDLYGTTSFGGTNGIGAVYQLVHSDQGYRESVIYSFQGASDGQNPVGGVILDQAGNLYGTTFDGGVNGGGTVYELSPSRQGWTFTVLYSFTGGYGGPYNDLTWDSSGNLYGTTNGDGAFGLGSVFKLTPGDNGWTLTDLHDFAGGNDGASPYGAVAVDAHGNVFGTAAVGGGDNQGVAWEITP